MEFNEYIEKKQPNGERYINASTLADFYCNPNALARGDKKKPSYDFAKGSAFESVLLDRLGGYDDARHFSKEFFVSAKDTAPPDDNKFNIFECISNGIDLKTKRVYNKPDKKTGEAELSGSHKARHAWIDECIENPGKRPITPTDYKKTIKLAESMLSLNVEGVAVSGILERGGWQVPLFWWDKKALADIVLDTKNLVFPFDIKTCSSFKNFTKIARQKYWIQGHHYCEGCESHYGKEAHPMIFLVASFEEMQCQEWRIEERKWEESKQAYIELVDAFRAWDWKESPHRKQARFWPDLRG